MLCWLAIEVLLLLLTVVEVDMTEAVVVAIFCLILFNVISNVLLAVDDGVNVDDDDDADVLVVRFEAR